MPRPRVAGTTNRPDALMDTRLIAVAAFIIAIIVLLIIIL